MNVEQAREFRARMDAALIAARVTVVDKLDDMDDPDAVAVLFDEWAGTTPYAVGDVVAFDDSLYRCVQAHTSQPDWTPPAVPALFARVRQTVGPAIDPWVQPLGAQDAYQIGDRVTHQDQTWESTAANNVWEPGVFGWTVT